MPPQLRVSHAYQREPADVPSSISPDGLAESTRIPQIPTSTMATESAGVAPPADPMMTTTTTTTSSQAAEQQDTAATTHDHEGMQQDHDHDHDHDNGRPGRGASSPPLPQRHTAATPGPRAARFQELYAQSLRHTLGKLGWDNVAGCYPTIARGAEGVLRQVQSQMVGKLGDKCEVSERGRERGRVGERGGHGEGCIRWPADLMDVCRRSLTTFSQQGRSSPS